MKNGGKFNWSRRNFLKSTFILGISSQFLHSCKQQANRIFLKLTGTEHVLGHRLRFPDFPIPTHEIHIPAMILGGGISGLSAAYQFKESGFEDFILVEMENSVGGNSRSGQNKYSKFPLGAHYLPIPNASNKEIYDFLEKSKIVTGWTVDHKPIFDEEQLTFSPQSRLFIKNYWQEGTIPEYSLSEEEKADFIKFFEQMKIFSKARGNDGKYVFDIPTLYASKNHDFYSLDKITMEKWMHSQGYQSVDLFEYVNYCCRDDFGTGIKYTSAFAGIHYFSSRKHDYYPDDDHVLTWQEGNSRLVQHLKSYADGKIKTNQLAYKIEIELEKVKVYLYDSQNDKSIIYIVDKLIISSPQFVNQYLLPQRKSMTKVCQYAPWITATVVLKKFPQTVGAPLSWDNVIHAGKGLGYIYNQHQSLGQFQNPFVLTYYHSMDGSDLRVERQKLYDYSDKEWRDFIIEDLSRAHFEIENEIESIEIFRLGHGMISPIVGFLSSNERKQLEKPIGKKIFFAHSDLSGISIFEESFYRGIMAAKEVIDTL